MKSVHLGLNLFLFILFASSRGEQQEYYFVSFIRYYMTMEHYSLVFSSHFFINNSIEHRIAMEEKRLKILGTELNRSLNHRTGLVVFTLEMTLLKKMGVWINSYPSSTPSIRTAAKKRKERKANNRHSATRVATFKHWLPWLWKTALQSQT